MNRLTQNLLLGALLSAVSLSATIVTIKPEHEKRPIAPICDDDDRGSSHEREFSGFHAFRFGGHFFEWLEDRGRDGRKHGEDDDDDETPAPRGAVPEPGTLGLMAGAFAIVSVARRRR